jgi:hypothetical protein
MPRATCPSIARGNQIGMPIVQVCYITSTERTEHYSTGCGSAVFREPLGRQMGSAGSASGQLLLSPTFRCKAEPAVSSSWCGSRSCYHLSPSRSLLPRRWRTWSWWAPRSLCGRVVVLELVVEVVLMEEIVLSSSAS